MISCTKQITLVFVGQSHTIACECSVYLALHCLFLALCLCFCNLDHFQVPVAVVTTILNGRGKTLAPSIVERTQDRHLLYKAEGSLRVSEMSPRKVIDFGVKLGLQGQELNVSTLRLLSSRLSHPLSTFLERRV